MAQAMLALSLCMCLVATEAVTSLHRGSEMYHHCFHVFIVFIRLLNYLTHYRFVRDRWRIARGYFRYWFWIDALSSVTAPHQGCHVMPMLTD
jgi:hypothetical protein